MLPQTLTTARKVFVAQGGGSTSWTTTAALTAVPASIQPGATPEAITAGAMRECKSWDIYLFADYDIKVGDTMNNPDGTGGTAEITLVQDLSGRTSTKHAVAVMEKGVDVK